MTGFQLTISIWLLINLFVAVALTTARKGRV